MIHVDMLFKLSIWHSLHMRHDIDMQWHYIAFARRHPIHGLRHEYGCVCVCVGHGSFKHHTWWLKGGLGKVGLNILLSRTVACMEKLVSGIASRARLSLGCKTRLLVYSLPSVQVQKSELGIRSRRWNSKIRCPIRHKILIYKVLIQWVTPINDLVL